jgi:hypothetical protein
MLDSIKKYYNEHSMYVNIALVVAVVAVAWKIFKKE